MFEVIAILLVLVNIAACVAAFNRVGLFFKVLLLLAIAGDGYCIISIGEFLIHSSGGV